MNRRLLTILLALALASLTAGCTTFSDNDAAARVDDTELSYDMLSEIATFIPDAVTGAPADPNSADHMRNAVRVWVEALAIEAEFERRGIDVDPALRDQVAVELRNIPGFTDLTDGSRDVLVGYVTSLNELQARDDGIDIIGVAIDTADIHIDPRIGTIDPQVGVIPLG